MTPEKYDKARSGLRKVATETIEAGMRENGVDIVLAASDSTLVSFAAGAGWPIGTVPLGNLDKNGQPFGFFALAPREDVLLRFMAAFHRTFQAIEEAVTCFQS